MNTTIPAVMGDSPNGERTLGNLRIAWQAWRSAAGAWQTRCTLWLGEAMAVLDLRGDRQIEDFQLYSEGMSAWGSVSLTPDADGNTLLAITCQSGSITEQLRTLSNWWVCRACDPVPPSHGRAFMGVDGWLQLSWTVTGSVDACQKVIVDLATSAGANLGECTLTPQQPKWEEVIRHSHGYAELLLTENFRLDGLITLDARLRSAQSPGEHAILAILPGASPAPLPEPDDRPGDTIVLCPPRNFASFAYPRALLPPSPGQQARRFFSLSNSGSFQTQLASLQTKPDRAGMLAQAQDFVAPDSKGYPGQFVTRIADLTGAMGRLHGPAVRAFLALRPDTAEALNAALESLLGEPVASFLQDPAYPGQLARLQDSLVALLVLGARLGAQEAALIRALAVCHVASWLDARMPGPQAAPTAAAEAASPASDDAASPEVTPPALMPTPLPLPTPAQMREALQANALLPANIFPLPQAPAASTVGSLGYADIKLIRQRLKHYRLGELAHVENVMRGETKEESRQQRRQTESRQHEEQFSHDSEQRTLDYDGRSNRADASASSPLNDLKREFDTLKKLYGDDGLSVTVTGGWTDTLDGPATLDDRAAHYARSLLDQASSRVARRIGTLRQQRTLEEFSEQHRRRFQNEAGNGHLVGIYRWVDEVHVAHLEQVGSRLILECTLSNPAADFLQRNNALHGINLSVPVPPWEAANGIGAIQSANDISRTNYLALAGLYGAEVRPPPPQQRLVNASLGSDPPHPTAMLAIPDGYLAASANLAYAWVTPPSPPSSSSQGGQSGTPPPPSFDVLVGGVAQKIDPASDPNPGSKTIASVQATDGSLPVSVIAAGLGYAVNVVLVCQCPDDSPLFRQWQTDSYAAIMAAYRQRMAQTNRVMGQLAEEFVRPGGEGRRETEREELQRGAIQALIAPFIALNASLDPPPMTPDQVEFELIPFFRQAVAWPEMSFSYSGRYTAGSPSAWLNMAQTVGRDDGFDEFLQAGSAKLLLPVSPGHVLPMLFYLGANGSFWFAPADLCPVFEADLWLANELKSLMHRPPELALSRPWEIEVATSMLMLQQDGGLPVFLGQQTAGTEPHAD